jgi:hypothetical protein
MQRADLFQQYCASHEQPKLSTTLDFGLQRAESFLPILYDQPGILDSHEDPGGEQPHDALLVGEIRPLQNRGGHVAAIEASR